MLATAQCPFLQMHMWQQCSPCPRNMSQQHNTGSDPGTKPIGSDVATTTTTMAGLVMKMGERILWRVKIYNTSVLKTQSIRFARPQPHKNCAFIYIYIYIYDVGVRPQTVDFRTTWRNLMRRRSHEGGITKRSHIWFSPPSH